MSYVDYSSHWSLDQFFTYLQANQLGSNDQHIVNTFSAEHNWNSSSVDGTHKALSASSLINTTPTSTGNQNWSNSSSYWTPASGIYQIVSSGSATAKVTFEIYISGSWRSSSTAVPAFVEGIFFCDGTNMRFYGDATGIGISADIYYQKF